ncbi:hypothetical protein Tsubulata_013016 [Turnera subulata]|uniref:PX domain-containing protein n=1 Tax=Turnera subulata TaxID=218843 RepID=A0A9Q0JKX3_9ROSI|nr:hypothetical protein Tsubulata_013016 [Turnera subulata]
MKTRFTYKTYSGPKLNSKKIIFEQEQNRGLEQTTAETRNNLDSRETNMNIYTHDLSLFDFANLSEDPLLVPVSVSHYLHRSSSSSTSSSSISTRASSPKPKSPPRHRHDGTSPLPLGMDWSPPPRKWDGRDSVWPHDHSTGWSYCVSIPSWILQPQSRGSGPVALYRVQVGIQSPDGVTTIRGLLRRFSDFLQLFSEVKKAFPQKTLPPAPPRKMLRMKSMELLEERRSSLEDWMEKLLSDIDISRSAPVGTFLELEAAARSHFDDVYQQNSDATFSTGEIAPSSLLQTNSEVSVLASSSSIVSDRGNDSLDGTSGLETPGNRRDKIYNLGMGASTCEPSIIDTKGTSVKDATHIPEDMERLSSQKTHVESERSVTYMHKHAEDISKAKSLLGEGVESLPEREYLRLDGHVRRLSTESIGSDLSSLRASEISNLGMASLFSDNSHDHLEDFGNFNLKFPQGMVVALPSDERHKLNRFLNAVRQRLATAKTDMEDLIARLNQEDAVKQYLTIKVKDLELDLETTRENCKENMQQAVLLERERFTQVQWDVEELRRQCLEMELKLKSEQDAKAFEESEKNSVLHEKEMLMQQLDLARQEVEKLRKDNDELELKAKADVKLLVKEVRALRGSQSELKQELSRLMKDKIEVERVLQKEKQRLELASAANVKLLRECEFLRDRLRECSVNFLVKEEDKVIVDSPTASDTIDLLTTSDNRIGLLLAEAQLLAQDVEDSVAEVDATSGKKERNATDDRLRKMLTEIFIDNAGLRMQVNSLIRSAIMSAQVKPDKDDKEEAETPSRKTVLSKFLER